jgi:twitching motility protein PilJ
MQTAFVDLQNHRNKYEQLLEKVFDGNQRNLSVVPAPLRSNMEKISQNWIDYDKSISNILNSRQSIYALKEAIEKLESVTEKLVSYGDEILTILVKKNVNSQQLNIATRQLIIIQRIKSQLGQILYFNNFKINSIKDLAQDMEHLGVLVKGLSEGDSVLNIRKLTDSEGRKKLIELATFYRSTKKYTDVIQTASPKLLKVYQSIQQIQVDSKKMLEEGEILISSVDAFGNRLKLLKIVAFILGGLALGVILILGYLMSRNSQRRLNSTNETNRRNQKAILRLLDEMTNLAEGDLTVHATVTEDITGAIADSVNYSIDALRSLVTTINQTAVKLSSAAEDTQGIAQRFAGASSHQAKEIAVATAAITEMAESIEQVSKNGLTSARVAKKAVQIAHKGATAVSRTKDGMGTIREQIQETSKRIKRLGESSQEIGDIVSLINEIADQTNILALNAAIQASTAGEAGRGFAVVADEVQRLAERSSNATKQIEMLVKTIQSDTKEAVSSMEQSTANVVAGAKLSENAGVALAEIETVSNQLAAIINSISQSAKQQSSAAANITNTMNVIQEITIQTSDGTAETANSVGNLTGLASKLRQSVSGFKLPASTDN